MSKQDTYEAVTSQLIEALESGTVPWRKTWTSKSGLPRNLKSGKTYRGINIIILGSAGYESPYWLTYKQAKELGGQVRKGEKSRLIIFWNWILKDADGNTVKDRSLAKTKIPLLRSYRVFNSSQCDGLEVPVDEQVSNQNDPIESAIEIAENYQDGPVVKHGFDHAAYSPAEDVVSMPNQERFACSEEYYGTLFHELVHSTGHESRLNRDALQGPINFASDDYGQEELVAEIGAAILSGQAGIVDSTIENSAAYCRSWIATLQADSKLAVNAAAAAQRAADRILGVTWD
jgi:antirestriction protein ArdC